MSANFLELLTWHLMKLFVFIRANSMQVIGSAPPPSHRNYHEAGTVGSRATLFRGRRRALLSQIQIAGRSQRPGSARRALVSRALRPLQEARSSAGSRCQAPVILR